MNFTLRVWRQASPILEGAFETYRACNISPYTSFLEMLDVVNEGLTLEGRPPIAFDSDCREGICGACGVMINGVAHGPEAATATCQLHMRSFRDGNEILVEPWRARAFPVIRDLVVDRSAFDRIIQAGGYISVSTGGTPDGNAIPIGKTAVDDAMNAAACIGCGACVAACPNASASLFAGSKIMHLGLLPQGQPERDSRVIRMVRQMDIEGFGVCSWFGECQEACPKAISIDAIKQMYGDFIKASWNNGGMHSQAYGASHPALSRESQAMESNCIPTGEPASEAAKDAVGGTPANDAEKDVHVDKSPTGMGDEAAEGINAAGTHVQGERSALDSRAFGRSFRAGAERSGSEPLVNRGWVHESGYGGKGGEPRVSSDQREDSERGDPQTPTKRSDTAPG